MANPFTLGDSIRDHDKAVYDWLGGLLVDYGTIAGVARDGFPILRIYASPQRAFAAVTDMLVEQNWLATTTAATMRADGDAHWPELPMPLATIDRDEPAPDSSLAGVPLQFRRVYLNPTTGKWETHSWPGHYLTTYRVTFRTVKKYTEAFLREWIYGQMGQIGAANNETFIHVTHPAPWGVQPHMLRFDGSVNLSALEGEESRMLVYEFSFTLRTWIFRKPTVFGDIIHGTGVDASRFGGPADGVGNDSVAVPNADPEPAEYTDNLFYFPVQPAQVAALWPKSGAATVDAGRRSPYGATSPASPSVNRSLRIGVQATSDAVELLERLTTPDTDGRSIVSASFAYSALENGASLAFDQHDVVGGTVSRVRTMTMPSSRAWQRVHTFAMVKQGAFIVSVAGAGGTPAADVTVTDIDVRQLSDGTRIPAGSVVVDGPDNVYRWSALESEPYLVVGIVTPAQAAGAFTVTAQDDMTSPDWQPAQVVDRAKAVGVVFMLQPLDGSVALRVPSSLSLDTAYLLRYHGPYNGHTV